VHYKSGCLVETLPASDTTDGLAHNVTGLLHMLLYSAVGSTNILEECGASMFRFSRES